MATIIIRNSTGSGVVPSSLVQGELAINTIDGKLFYGSGSGNVVKEFTGSGGGGSTTLAVGTTPITSGTIGRVLFEGTGNVLQQSANLFWDNTNGRLGIGTATPQGRLDVSAGLGTQTAGDLVVDTTNNIVYIGKLDSASGNTNLIFRNRLGGVKSRWANAGAGSIWFGDFVSGYGVGIQQNGITTETTLPGNAMFHVNKGTLGGTVASFINGNVGIGTISPVSTLDVSGSSRFNGTTLTLGTTGLLSTWQGTNHSLYFYHENSTTFRILSSLGPALDVKADSFRFVNSPLVVGANVTPLARLHVQGSGTTSATTALQVENTNASASLVVRDDGSTLFAGSNGTSAGTWVDATGSLSIIRGSFGTTYGLRVYNGAGWSGHNAIQAIAYQYPIYGAQGGNGVEGASPLNAGAGVYGQGGVGVHGRGITPSGDTGSIGVMATSLYVHSGSNTALYNRSASVHILATDTSSNYSFLVQNSSGQTLFSAQNDRTVNINSTNISNGNTTIGTTNGSVIINQGYNNTFRGNSINFYSGGDASTIQGFTTNPGIAIGYAQSNANPNTGSVFTVKGTAASSGSGVLFVTGSSTTKLLTVASETSSSILVVSGSGNIGINTNTPAYNLDINGTARVNGFSYFTAYATSVQRVQFNNGTVAGNLGYVKSSVNGIIQLADSSETDFNRLQFGGSTSLFPALQRSGSSLCVVDAAGGTNTSLLVGLSGSAYGSTGISNGRLTINNTSGNNGLAIRTGETGYQLGIRTTVNDAIGAEFVWHDGATFTFLQHGGAIGTRLGVSGYAQFRANFNNPDGNATIHTGASNLERFRVTNAGLVGVNTSSSISAQFQIKGSGTTNATTTLRVENNNASASLVILDNGSSSFAGNVTISGSTLVGSVASPALNDTTRVTANIGVTTIYSVATGSYDGAFFDYIIRSGSNARAGQIMGLWSGSSVNFTETTTTDFGSTSNFTFGMSISASNMILSGSTTSNGWTVKTIVRSI